MKRLSLVGLKAIDVATELAREGMFVLTSYNAPLALVIPIHYTSKREFYNALDALARELFTDENEP